MPKKTINPLDRIKDNVFESLKIQLNPNNFKKAEKYAIIAELYKYRYNRNQIANYLGADNKYVGRVIREIHESWIDSAIENIEIVRVRELADYDEMEKICIDRLERLEGNPHQGTRWMEERRKIKENRARLLGLNAAQKFETERRITVISKEERDAALAAVLGGRIPKQINEDPDHPEQIEYVEAETIVIDTDESSEKDRILQRAVINANKKD